LNFRNSVYLSSAKNFHKKKKKREREREREKEKKKKREKKSRNVPKTISLARSLPS
jgi:hypothetical protein